VTALLHREDPAACARQKRSAALRACQPPPLGPIARARGDYNVKACKRQDSRRLFGHKDQNRTATLP